MADTCTGPTCGRELRWTLTLEGRRIPLDPEPTADGNVVLDVDSIGRVRAHVLAGDDLPWTGAVDEHRGPFMPHRATCSDSSEFKRRQLASTPRCRPCGLPMGRLGNRGDRRLVELETWTCHPSCDPGPGAAAARAALAGGSVPVQGTLGEAV